jgi:hypothetical protein
MCGLNTNGWAQGPEVSICWQGGTHRGLLKQKIPWISKRLWTKVKVNLSLGIINQVRSEGLRERRCSSAILNLGHRRRLVVPGNHWLGEWVGLRAGLDVMEKRKSLDPTGNRTLIPRSFSHFASCYADWMNPAPTVEYKFSKHIFARGQAGFIRCYSCMGDLPEPLMDRPTGDWISSPTSDTH